MSIAKRRRPGLVLVLAGALSLAISLATVPLPTTPTASAATNYWTMLVNNQYDGVNSSGPMQCLSANQSTSSSGSGTHSVYTATCNAGTPGQWWRILSLDEPDGANGNPIRNYVKDANGNTWCLSGNETTPPDGFAGTQGVYTSLCSAPERYQKWNLYIDGPNQYFIRHLPYHAAGLFELSTTSSSPYPAGTYKVFNAQIISHSNTHLWRLYNARSTEPTF